ncbi:MAG: radical SAM protein [Candidatus Lokiarchaeota archaeon]|nr:radical SAM protein [Candidatus Lokiarchaeota archaeon]
MEFKMRKLFSGPFKRVLLVKPHGPSGLAFALNPIPLGLEAIAGYIRNHVDDILIFDEFMDDEPINRILLKFKPDLVGFSLSATEHENARKLMNKIKKFNSRIPIIAGGYHPTGASDAVLNDLQCDAICRGEGEELFLEFVQGKEWTEIKGLSFRDSKNNEIIHNEDRELIKDLDTLPFPARDLRKKRGYSYHNILLLNREYDLMEFGRGCYGKCTFCCEPYYSRGHQRYRSPERTLEEIRSIWKLHGGKPLRILIADPNIMGNPRKVEQLADLLIKEDLDITFQIMTRTEMIVKHPKIVEKMIRAGMISWELGIESCMQDDLDITDKRIPLTTQIEAVSILRKMGGEVLGTFVIGLSNHTSEDIKMIPNYAREIGLSASAFGIATPFPGTGYWDELDSKGLIFEKNWTKFDENNNVFTHPTLTPDEITDLRNWCLAKYWNLDTIVEQIRLGEIRIGKFRAKYKANLVDFATLVMRRIFFAVDAGSELAEKGMNGNSKENYLKYVKFFFDAWADPRIERYFTEYPMHEIVDMRQFGKLFNGKRFQAVIQNGHNKCVFALLITVGPKGIKLIKTSKKPTRDYDFMIRSPLDALYIDQSLNIMGKARQLVGLFAKQKVQIKGYYTFFKMLLYGIKEALSNKLGNGKK